MTTPTDIDDDIDPRVERSRAAVVAASAALLLDEGPDAITHGRVAAAAGVSRTTVYKHYPERSDLLHATLSEIGKDTPSTDALSGDFGPDLRFLLGMLAGDLADEGRARLISTMMARAQHDVAVATVRDDRFRDFRHAFGVLLQRGIDDGLVRTDIDVDRAMAALAGSLLFAKFMANLPVDDELLDGIIDDFRSTNAPR
ncbi:MAG: TetR/AcrR family transcriptional regulator [Ilumatobacter sp.]|nr:TetR/AcrR family transcriptional regulator [Ilumatobacter sp.]